MSTSPEALLLLYSKRKEQMLAHLWQSNPRSSMLASMLSSWELRQGNAQGAREYIPHVESPEERALKLQTARLLPELTAPLQKEPRVHLLLLVYNRIAYLEQALRQLAATAYDNYALYILDNGSCDGSGAIAARAKDFFPPHIEVRHVVMPFNLGRPLGHNWLLTQFDHTEAEFIAIGDDDLVKVPPAWMADMVKTLKVFPEAGLVGGKALDPSPVKQLQSGIRRLASFTHTDIKLLANTDTFDLGQQDYVDQADHVIGCLNIYRKSVFTKECVGLFDIRYSPCQFVDVDHHLRMGLAGISIIYNGLVEFQHARAMGNEIFPNKPDATHEERLRARAAMGNSNGNKFKLIKKFDQKCVADMIQNRQEQLAARINRVLSDELLTCHTRVEA